MTDNDREQEGCVFEIALAVPKWGENRGDEREGAHCVDVLVEELRQNGLIVERDDGLQNEFIKLAASDEVIGRAAAALQFRKPTYLGMDLPFEWEEAEAFIRLPDGSLFSWCERFHCYNHIIYGIVNTAEEVVVLRSDCKEENWKPGESLLLKLEAMGVVKEVFPLHDEKKRKQLLKSWAMNWSDVTHQPIDDICAYYGMKIATYFTFLGMYTRWLLFPASLGLVVQLMDFGSLQFAVLPFFFMSFISWVVLFFQFWKRKNAAISARLQIYNSASLECEYRFIKTEPSLSRFPSEHMRKQNIDRMKEKANFQREEWFTWLLRVRNDAFIILSIICLQLPFELAYAHLYEDLGADVLKFGLTAVYLLVIQYFTRMGGKVAVKLIKYEKFDTAENKANSLVYKVFGVYFMQSYIGVFYHALLHRNITTLRQLLIQRLVISEVIENLLENAIPYLSYRFKKYRAGRNKGKRDKESSTGKSRFTRVEKEYLKPAYNASIGQEIEDGLFDDFLELVLQFGMIMMFACAFPLAFAFAAMNNITEIRADALKLLAMMRRPTPRAEETIGAWLNIFQFLIVMSICTNSALLVCMYDREGNWNLSPGLAAILAMEHVLLFIKFGFSSIVPEEPAWVRAARLKNATQAEQVCTRQLLKSLYGDEKCFEVLRSHESKKDA
ncbi:anoctamin-like protein At1g73020 isoform X1 [Salvia hispanica]|uniref:anoctamin-like protein At1g73020 isoform X1 n=1 Tax=Salvia hispanica TaxID=49212 RepID=UPI002009AA48|nr:anoctamin-like protein At1g73020 isoform X1 [Salvia hispanica]XP_047962823.1 anoctamin-like protein At1g73020 isoform X1 [Salvia hispanica]